MAENDKQEIIVVSGLPRSGTSMMMKMLDAAGLPVLTDSLRKADEDNPKGYFELEPVKDLGKTDDISWLEDASGKVVKIVSPLLKHLPREGYRYKVIFTQRNLYEILASQKKMLVRRDEPTDAIADEDMAQFFMRDLEAVRELLDGNDCFETAFFRYRQVLEEPVEQAKRIIEFLGLSSDPTEMAGVVDPSLYRNRS